MARLTPVTTAMSACCFAYRTELVRQDPPGRSTNSTAGPLPTACVSRSASASVPHPSLDTGVNAPSIPVMTVTALTRACATAACDTMTPRNGEESLIIFLQILLHLSLLPHAPNQPFIERVRRVDSAVAQ